MEKVTKRLSWKNFIATPQSEATSFINYDDKKNILEVKFPDGVYHYFDVPQNVWEGFKDFIEAGGSSGKFVNLIIKPYYKYEKVDE